MEIPCFKKRRKKEPQPKIEKEISRKKNFKKQKNEPKKYSEK